MGRKKNKSYNRYKGNHDRTEKLHIEDESPQASKTAAEPNININVNVSLNSNDARKTQNGDDVHLEETQGRDAGITVLQKALKRSLTRFIEDLCPDSMLDHLLSTNCLSSVDYRDIKELQLTTQKNRAIVNKVLSRGDKGCKEFKDALKKSDQHPLLEYLEQNEKKVELEKEESRNSLSKSGDSLHQSKNQPADKIFPENPKLSYAKAVSGVVDGKDTSTCTVIVNLPEKEKIRNRTEPDIQTGDEVSKFLKAVNNFKGHYVLLIDKCANLYNLEALALVPWIAVLDFDPKSRETGVLSQVEHNLKTRRSLHIVNIQNKNSFTEQSTNWIFMVGCQERPDTLTQVEYKKWRKEIKQSLNFHLQKLKEFSEGYTLLTLVIVWSNKGDKSKHIQFTVDLFDEVLSPSIVFLYEDLEKLKVNDPVLDALEADDDIQKIHITLQEMCSLVSTKFTQQEVSVSNDYQLPGIESDPGISEEKTLWLSEDLQVIYLNNKTGIHYEQDALSMEEDLFYKGGTLHWAWWYQVGPGHLDIERDQTHDIVENIRKKYIHAWKSGIITLYHAPGAGGTTLAQRVLWTLRKDVPCAQLKRGSSSTVVELTEKIRFLCDKSSKPVFILIDGEDEQRVESVKRILREHCVILFYVKRYPYRINQKLSNIHDGKVLLNSGVSKYEASVLGLKYSKQCNSSQKTQAITHLVIEVENGMFHSIFDFGLTVHNYEYKGIESYVKGYLRLDEKSDANLEPWQKAVAYLAFVYYYGQTVLPCFYISFILNTGGQNILEFEDLPREMSEFIVKEENDGKKNVVRISHYLIAKEILDQILTRDRRFSRKPSPHLCSLAKQRVCGFAVEFVKTTGEIYRGSLSNMLRRTVTRTFISRDNKIVGESETQANRSKRQKLSQILEDVGNPPPSSTEKFRILQQLTDSFPSEAQFRAHLGRLYTICRPEEEEKAEKCFKKALDICLSDVENLPVEDIPYTKRQDLRNIYHMYGNMFVLRIAKYTGKNLGDIPVRNTDASHFHETATTLLESVRTACDLFYKCRDTTPQGCEESFGYIGEIQIRLMFCDFVNSKCEEGNLHNYVENHDHEIADFVEQCYTVLDELFIECFSAIEPENMDNNVRNCTEWYAAIFNTRPTHGLSRLRPYDDVYSRRMYIATLKMKYSSKKSFGVLEMINNVSDISFIVKAYEKNLKAYEESNEQRPSTRAVDIDYREWLYAIRHQLCPEDYEIEFVLQHVQSWYDLLHSPYSRFYLFVLKSLLGIGIKKGGGNSRLLIEAQQLKEEVCKYSKYMAKPRYPREWLGPATTTIRRLAQGKRFFGQMEGKGSESNFEIRTGTISPPNDKPASGTIYLDLGPDNNVSVKVFFVPATCEMKGTSYQGTRVQFKIGFSMSHGYDAFDVRQIGHVFCEKCNRHIENRSCDTAVPCPGCRSEIKVK